MRLCIYGAGAIGGLLGARLIETGEQVVLIARGEHLAALRQHGLRLRVDGTTRAFRPALATSDPREAGPQDAVIVATKATAGTAVAESIAPLLDAETAVVTAVNGIPWWYFHKHGGVFEGRPLASVDPQGAQWRLIGPERAVGCVVYPAAELIEPGIVEHRHGQRFMLGEPDGSESPRIRDIAAALTQAGFKAPIRRRIRDDIWLKLWGNLSFNPVSALTCATLSQIAADAGGRRIVRGMMAEAQAVAEALGARFLVDIDTRIGWAADVGEHRTSMLQDLELGRPLEIEALTGVVSELGKLVELATPTVDLVLDLLRLRARQAGPHGLARSVDTGSLEP